MTTHDVVVRRLGSGEELARTTFATAPEALAYLARKGPAYAGAPFTAAVETADHPTRGVQAGPGAVH